MAKTTEYPLVNEGNIVSFEDYRIEKISELVKQGIEKMRIEKAAIRHPEAISYSQIFEDACCVVKDQIDKGKFTSVNFQTAVSLLVDSSANFLCDNINHGFNHDISLEDAKSNLFLLAKFVALYEHGVFNQPTAS